MDHNHKQETNVVARASTLDKALKEIYSRDRDQAIKWLVAFPRHSHRLQTTDLVLYEKGKGERSLFELKARMQSQSKYIAFILLRWPITVSVKCKPLRASKYIFGRFVGTEVEAKVKKSLFSTPTQQRLIKPFDVRHLSLNADETMKGWTAENLTCELSSLSQAPCRIYVHDVCVPATKKAIRAEECDDEEQKQQRPKIKQNQQIDHDRLRTENERLMREVRACTNELKGAKADLRDIKRERDVLQINHFMHKEEAEEFGRAYYEEVLHAMCSADGITEDSTVIDEYFERDTTEFAGNGQAIFGVQSWVKSHREFAYKYRPSRPTLDQFKVIMWNSIMFVATYDISIQCNDHHPRDSFSDRRMDVCIKGRATIALNAQKKIRHITETSETSALPSRSDSV